MSYILIFVLLVVLWTIWEIDNQIQLIRRDMDDRSKLNSDNFFSIRSRITALEKPKTKPKVVKK